MFGEIMRKKEQRNKDSIFEVILYACLIFQVIHFWAPLLFEEYAYGVIIIINRLPQIIPNNLTFNNFIILSYVIYIAGFLSSFILLYKRRGKKFLIIFMLELVLLLIMIWATIESSKWSYM